MREMKHASPAPARMLGRWLRSVVFLLCLAGMARAEILYSNGAIVSGNDGWTISGPYKISNSFVLSSSATVGAINGIGLYVASDGVPLSMTWSIGTVQFGTDIVGQTSTTPGYILMETGIPGYDVYAAGVDVGGLSLSAGTYWITLQSAASTSPTNNLITWIQSGGSSAGRQQANSNPATTISSESFAVDTVPEPSTYALAGLAVLVLGIAARGRLRSVWSSSEN